MTPSFQVTENFVALVLLVIWTSHGSLYDLKQVGSSLLQGLLGSKSAAAS